MFRPYLPVLALAAGLSAPASAQPLVVTGGDVAHTDVVVTAPLPADAPAGVNVVELFQGGFVPAQVDGKTVTFVVQKLAANESATVRLGMLNYVQAPPQFDFVDKPGEAIELYYAGKPVLKYINAPHDTSTKEKHEVTFKVFHHVYDPVTGKIELTSGAYPFSDKSKKFPHHRGLFYGWMKVNYGDGKKADVWHGRAGEFTQHEKVVDQEAGPVFGRQTLAISWHGKDGDTFANEERTVTAYQTSGGTLIDWASTLTTELPKVTLDGDPQHAGFHFRAAQEVAKSTAKQTYYLRPDGKDEPGKTKNWPGNKDHVNLPWDAMSFVVGGKRFTTLYMAHPDNPGEARHSERDYGRFGSYFVYDLTPDKPLSVKYRVWVQEGEMTQKDCEEKYAAFVTPPKVISGK